jgi:hypothetical protein
MAPEKAAAPEVPGEAGRALQALLNERFRSVSRLIPEWEAQRGEQAAETYYLPRLLRHEMLAEIVTGAGRAHAEAAGTPLIAGTSEWMPVDATLFQLGQTGLSGGFTVWLPEEKITLRLAEGKVVAVLSNNPRRYCAGADYAFRTLPAPVIAAAVAAQQRDGTPFFMTLQRMGQLKGRDPLQALLRTQGVRAVGRALSAAGSRYAFVPGAPGLEWLRCSLDCPVSAFVFEVMRGMDNWLEIEAAVGSGEKVYAIGPEAPGGLPELGLTAAEAGLVGRMDGRVPLQELAEATEMGLYEASALIYRLKRLGLVREVAGSGPEGAMDDADVEAFLQVAESAEEAEPVAAEGLADERVAAASTGPSDSSR